MENKVVRKAIDTEIDKLAEIIRVNSGCHLELTKRGDWTLYSTKPDWGCKEARINPDGYAESLTIAKIGDYDFNGATETTELDDVIFVAMARASGIAIQEG